MTKITLIGAGSVEFTKNLLADLLTMPEADGTTIALHDIDPDRLATAEAVARWTNEATGGRASIEATLDRREALDGAAYAVNEIQVGGYTSTVIDFEVPARYGVRQTIGDTIGVGGIFRGLRTIPVLLDIARDMTEVCPDAWLLNYTNPMAMVCWAVGEAFPRLPILGVCHSVRDTCTFLASTVGVAEAEIDFLAAGFNHQAFVLRFERGGDSLYPLLDAAIEAHPELRRRVRVELYRRFGFFPTESSEHSAEYVPWFMRDDGMIDRFRIPVGEYLRRSQENLGEYDETKRRLASGEGFDIEPTGELASQFIQAREAGGSRTLYGTVRNAGLIDDLSPRAAVEVPVDIVGGEPRPRRAGSLPPQLAALNQTFAAVCELTVTAVLEGRRDHVYHAAMLDPNTGATLTPDAIRSMCDELIEAHGDLIPEGIRRG